MASLTRTAIASTSAAAAPVRSRAARALRSRLPRTSRHIHDYVRGTTADGMAYKVPLSSPKVVGTYSSRGERQYLEDTFAVCAIDVELAELRRSLPSNVKWHAPSERGEVAYVGIYDGHGGRAVSTFLKDNLAELVESVVPEDIPGVVESTIEVGGYFRRWRGGELQRWTRWNPSGHKANPKDGMTIDERLTLAFLKADQMVHEGIEGGAEHCGSTASVVLIQSLDVPPQPHFAAKKVHLTIAQVGDTRVLLCNAKTGEVIPLTEKHHAEARGEATRLRQMGADRLVSDSFGETRWMGAIENTRGFGDFEWKSSGVTAEPEITHRVIDGDENAYLIFVTDGLTSLLSDQELVDLARNAADPTRAAKTIVHFGEDLGAQDNCTCCVVPLAAWGNVGGEDTTEARREYRREQAGLLNTRMQRM